MQTFSCGFILKHAQNNRRMNKREKWKKRKGNWIAEEVLFGAFDFEKFSVLVNVGSFWTLGKGNETKLRRKYLTVCLWIALFEQVDDMTADFIISQLLFLDAEDPKKDIKLFINSPGGSVTAGMSTKFYPLFLLICSSPWTHYELDSWAQFCRWLLMDVDFLSSRVKLSGLSTSLDTGD